MEGCITSRASAERSGTMDRKDGDKVQLSSPKPLGRVTENRVKKLGTETMFDAMKHRVKPMESGSKQTTMQSVGGKRRLTPMELKRQQRMEKEKRLRTHLPLKPESHAVVPDHSEVAPGSAAPHQHAGVATVAGSGMKDAPAERQHNRPKLSLSPQDACKAAPMSGSDGLLARKELLRRSASSPPSITIDTG